MSVPGTAVDWLVAIVHADADRAYAEQVQEVFNTEQNRPVELWGESTHSQQSPATMIERVDGQPTCIILVATPQFLKSRWFKAERLKKIAMDKESRKDIQVLVLHAEPTQFQKTQWMRKLDIVPEDQIALSKKDQKEQVAALHEMQVAAYTWAFSRSQRKTSTTEEQGDQALPKAPKRKKGRQAPGPLDHISDSNRLALQWAMAFGVSMGLRDEVPPIAILAGVLSVGRNASSNAASNFLYCFLRTGFQNREKSIASLVGLGGEPEFVAPNEALVMQPDLSLFSKTSIEIIQRARSISNQVKKNGQPLVHVRHTIAALLDAMREDSPSLDTILGDLGHESVRLFDSFYRFLTTDAQVLGDDMDAWRRIVDTLQGTSSFKTVMSGRFVADAPEGRDLLGVEAEATAFAELITSRRVQPPLSVGIFGRWGCGKSFFLQAIQREVDRLATLEQESPTTHRVGHLKQIEFNAWHFSEGNLWASLATHLFDRLGIFRDPTIKERVMSLKDDRTRELREWISREEEAAARVEEKEKQEEHARRALELAEGRMSEFHDAAGEAAAGARAGSTASVYQRSSAIVREMESMGESLGIQDASAAAHGAMNGDDDAGEQLYYSLKERIIDARTYGRLRAPYFLGKGHQRRSLMLLFSASVFLLTVASILTLRLVPSIDLPAWTDPTKWAVAGTSLLTLLGVFINGLTIGGRWINQGANLLTRIADAKREEESRRERELRERQTRYEQVRRDRDDAYQKYEEAVSGLEDAYESLKMVSPHALLQGFIKGRVEADDYRQFLGVHSSLRRDFEYLSELLCGAHRDGEEDNDYLERIVLYIDDLDRVPSAKVVEVLQAVHLLLAFPAFVVVLAVDTRWLLRSLEEYYVQTLGPGLGEDRNDAGDFLEKIFQIPYWMEDIPPHVRTEMIAGLVEDAQQFLETGSDQEPDIEVLDDGGATSAFLRSNRERTAPRGEVRTEANGQSVSERSEEDPLPLDREPRVEAEIEVIQVTDSELRFMQELGVLLPSSPRSIKRFVNIYRLMKIGITASMPGRLRDVDSRLSGSRAILLTLAIQMRLPSMARSLSALERELAEARENASFSPPDDEVEWYGTVEWVLRRIESELDDSPGGDVEVLRNWFARHAALLEQDAYSWLEWSHLVSRYSFVGPAPMTTMVERMSVES